ncbi:MAG: hypothetical protein ACI8UD_000207, partial [Planctomycetota bacterium]
MRSRRWLGTCLATLLATTGAFAQDSQQLDRQQLDRQQLDRQPPKREQGAA